MNSHPTSENMEFHLILLFLTFISVALVASQETDRVSPDAYWKSVLPNSPMPKALKDILPNGKSTSVGVGKVGVKLNHGNRELNRGQDINIAWGSAEPNSGTNVGTLYFFEKDLKRGTKMTLHFPKTTNAETTVLPRHEAEKIPFSSEKMPEILDQFSMKPDSKEAELMTKIIKICEMPGIKGEEKYCATSLESMIDFITSKLGKNVQPISIKVEKETKLQEYRISESTKMGGGGKNVVCHKLNYAYTVFYCHKSTTKAYMVSLAGVDGTTSKAVALCHTDTSAWNPKHFAFQVLKVKPGTVPVCHFLAEGNVVWLSN